MVDLKRLLADNGKRTRALNEARVQEEKRALRDINGQTHKKTNPPLPPQKKPTPHTRHKNKPSTSLFKRHDDLLRPPPQPLTPTDNSSSDYIVNIARGGRSDDPLIRSLLSSGSIRAYYRSKNRHCPSCVLQWLWNLTLYGESADIVVICAHTLLDLLEMQGEFAGWIPSPDDFLQALKHLGADESELTGSMPARRKVEAGCEFDCDDDASASPLTQAAASESDEDDENGHDRDLRVNLEQLLTLAPICATHWRNKLQPDEQIKASRWLCRLLAEAHAYPVLLDVQDALSALLHEAAANRESPVMREVDSILRSLSNNILDSAMYYKVCILLPPTSEGICMQRKASVCAMRLLMEQVQAEFVNAVELKNYSESICEMVRKCHVSLWTEHTDSLHTFFLLLDIALSKRDNLDSQQIDLIRRHLGSHKMQLKQLPGALDYHILECESLATHMLNLLLLEI